MWGVDIGRCLFGFLCIILEYYLGREGLGMGTRGELGLFFGLGYGLWIVYGGIVIYPDGFIGRRSLTRSVTEGKSACFESGNLAVFFKVVRLRIYISA